LHAAARLKHPPYGGRIMERATDRSLWPWAVGLLLVIVLTWALSGHIAGRNRDVEVKEPVPEAG
jgi:hypothetical protein